MATATAANVASLNGFHANSAAQRADKLVRAILSATNTAALACMKRPMSSDRDVLVIGRGVRRVDA